MSRIFAACPPGIEDVLSGELLRLGYESRVTPGGAEVEGDTYALVRMNLWLRSASRVLLRVGEFHADGFPELVRKSVRLPWENWLRAGQKVALRVTCHKSKLYHSGAVAERIALALTERLGGPIQLVKAEEDADSPPQILIARLEHDQCSLSLDTSGELLHRRGYRLSTAKAPLRENLAAAMLLRLGYDGSQPFLDPFCGSGTLPIEAALIASGRAPGLLRDFQLLHWPRPPLDAWEELSGQAEKLVHRPAAWIRGYDRDAGAVQACLENAARAGMAELIHFETQAVSHLRITDPAGLLVTNPPYGQRVRGGADLRDLYARFGAIVSRQLSGWRVAWLCNDRVLAGHTGLRPQPVMRFSNGGIPVALYEAAKIS